MGEIVISVRGLGKSYRLYDQPSDRLREALFRRWKTYHRDHWALRGIDLEVRRGEKLGIIGRNGAGKSTLLQVIAGTLQPTEGEVRRVRKVYTILELGTGFNPELTGRENMRTTGALMGLTKVRIDEILGEMIAFADIGEYIDQPTKTYSTGMFARVAMAAALHVRAELLLIDEILAVGDVFFQRKCFERIGELMEQGGTAVICSHNLGAVRRYCDRVAYLRNGRLIANGDPDDVLSQYLKDGRADERAKLGRPAGKQAGASDEAGPAADQAPSAPPAPPAEAAPPPGRPRPAPEWQLDDEARGVLRSPRGIALLPDGHLLVAELRNHGLFELDQRGRLLRCWTREGFGPGEVYDAVGLEPRSDGSVVTADYSAGRVLAFYPDGRSKRLWPGRDVGGQPFLVRFGPDGKAWICSRQDGVRVLGGGQCVELFAHGTDDCLITEVAFHEGEAYLADLANHEVLVLDGASARLRRKLQLEELGEGPHGIAFLGDRMLVTCHNSNDLVVLPPGAHRRDGQPAGAVSFSLDDFAVNHPCYILPVAGRAYISCATLGGILALDVSDFLDATPERAPSPAPQHQEAGS